MAARLTFVQDGAQRFRRVAGAELAIIEEALAHLPEHLAGTRLRRAEALKPFLDSSGPVGAVAESAIGPGARPVRAILFDKTAQANWSLGWHQDRTIAVESRRDVPGFGPWTLKSGILHVAPPFHVLAGMATLRLHLDPVSATNAPLLIAPGSHRFGRVSENDIEHVVQRCGTAVCEAERGDVWAYATPILHASDAARVPLRRRVLQIDYAALELPGGLQWLGL